LHLINFFSYLLCQRQQPKLKTRGRSRGAGKAEGAAAIAVTAPNSGEYYLLPLKGFSDYYASAAVISRSA